MFEFIFLDEKRRKILKISYVIAVTRFIGCFISICFDISRQNSESKRYVVPIFIFELLFIFPVTVLNLLYFLTIQFGLQTDARPTSSHSNTFSFLRLFALTGFRCKCYRDHPAGMHLTRLAILTFSFSMNFVNFILGTLCATDYNPIGVPYAVLSGVFLVPALLALVVEMLHFHVLWRFSEKKFQGIRHHGLLAIFPYNMTYLERLKFYDADTNHSGCTCRSASLYHTFIHHSPTWKPKIPIQVVMDNEVIIAYRFLKMDEAIRLSQEGFQTNKYGRLPKEFYFTRYIEKWDEFEQSNEGVLMMARICVGHVIQVDDQGKFDLEKFREETPEPHALELMPQRWILVMHPKQIENWVIIYKDDNNKCVKPDGYLGLV